MDYRERQLVQSKDGSHTIFVPSLNEHYHSIHGAIQESGHVFIESGLGKVAESLNNIRVLEAGFGTGLNALLTFLYARNNGFTVHYTGVEPEPLPESISRQLNYAGLLGNEEVRTVYEDIMNSAWNKTNSLSEKFSLLKRNLTIQDFFQDPGIEKFNLIYFDAFSPEVQPEMWTLEVFINLYSLLSASGVLVTYCCKGTVKRNLKAAGFGIEKLPGPPGKREILRACIP